MYATQLRNLMKDYSLSQQAISKLAGIPLDTIKSWLSSPLSKRHRSMGSHEFYMVKSRILFAKNERMVDKQYLLSSNIDSALYHLENALKALDANSIEETKKYLDVALDSVNIAFFTKIELGLDPMYNELNADVA